MAKPTTDGRLAKELTGQKQVPEWISTFTGAKASIYSDAEWAVAWALQHLGYKEWDDYVFHAHIIDEFQPVDFYVPAVKLIIRVQGVHFHYELGPDIIAYDTVQKQIFESMGYLVVDIDGDDALKNPVYYVKEALLGIDHSRASRGL